MSDALVLRLSGVLQSWGTGREGAYRDTESDPTLSGVVGLVANAEGRDRSDDVSDLAALWFGSRADAPGVRLRDFFTAGQSSHTVKRTEIRVDGKRFFKDTVTDENVLGEKEFLSGATFTVVLCGDREIIERAAAAVRNPARTLFLGRKACPVGVPVFVDVVRDVTDPEQLLVTVPAQQPLIPERSNPYLTPSKDGKLRIVVPSTPAEPRARAKFDRPVSFASNARSYLPRYVAVKYVPAPVEVTS